MLCGISLYQIIIFAWFQRQIRGTFIINTNTIIGSLAAELESYLVIVTQTWRRFRFWWFRFQTQSCSMLAFPAVTASYMGKWKTASARCAWCLHQSMDFQEGEEHITRPTCCLLLFHCVFAGCFCIFMWCNGRPLGIILLSWPASESISNSFLHWRSYIE